MFNLRSGLKVEWIYTDLPDYTTGWRSEWFYIADQLPGLPRRTGHKPVKINESDLGLSSRDLAELKSVLELVGELKKQGVTGAEVARSFCRRMIQPIKDRVHPADEYWGQSDPTREVNRMVSKEEMVARVSQMYSKKVKVKKCPKVHLLKRPADPVRS
jgi:polyhydroxyalkanoate synthesis regulator phasin